MAANLDQLRQQIDDLREQYLKLTAKPAALFQVNNIQDAEKAVDTLNKAVSQAREEARRLDEGFGGIADSVRAIVNELNKSRTPLNLATNAFKQIEESARKLKFDQQGLNDLNKKQLEDEVKKQKIAQQTIREQALRLAQEKGIVDISKDNLSLRRDLSNAEREILEALKEGFPLFDEINDKLDKRLDKEKEFQKSLGITGKLAGVLGKIPFFGQGASEALKDTEKEIRALNRAGKPIPNRFQTMGMMVKKLKGSIKESLTDPLVLGTALGGLLVKGFLDADKATVGLQKNLSLSSDDAAKLNRDFSATALSSDSLVVNSRNMAASVSVIQDKMGSIGKISAESAETFARLSKAAGVAEDAAAGLVVQSEAFGKNSDETYLSTLQTTQQVSQQYKTQVNQKAVLTEVGKASAYTLVQFRGSTQALTEAVAKSKALGLSLESVSKISSGLLNFQQSIEDELSAELLTGKQLNLEQARYYALTNQQSKLMDELNSQIGTFSDFSNMNVVQQEAYSKALGMSSNELSEMLFKQEYRGKTEQDIANIADEDLRKRVEALSIQDKFQAATEKLSATFADFVAGPVGSFLTSIDRYFTVVGLIAGSTISYKMVTWIAMSSCSDWPFCCKATRNSYS
jgi:hypothetical protein